jgi:hypothetical protein
MDSPSAATQLQHGTMVELVTLQLQAASCFGLKTLKAARLDASTVWTRRRHCIVGVAARGVHSSMAMPVGWGPFFHGNARGVNGSCVRLCHGNNPASSHFQPCTAYPDTTGLGSALFTGAAQFTLEDYEVWAAT